MLAKESLSKDWRRFWSKLSDKFDSFNEIPVVAASILQVIKRSKIVTAKILRLNCTIIYRGYCVFEYRAEVINHSWTYPLLRSYIFLEFLKNFVYDSSLHIPRLYCNFNQDKITLEFIDGRLFNLRQKKYWKIRFWS